MGQEMLLLPRMLQSIQILQLPGLELESYLRQAAEENEALVVEDAEPRPEPPERFERRPRGTRDATDRHDEWLQNQPDREHGLAEFLEEQLALLDAEPRTLDWARFLIRSIDDNGYLTLSDDELLARAALDGLDGGASELAAAQAVLASLEPRGIGARDAIDALVRQLDPGDPEYAALRRLLAEFLGELARNKLPHVAREMKLSVDEVRALLARLSELDPRPAARLATGTAPPILPDVVVEPTAEGFDVRVDRSGWPAVAVDPTIAQIARDRRQPGEVRRYLRGKIDKARWIVEALELRGTTLLEIARALFARQRAFLERGPGHLAPLKMTDLAAEVGLHTSTVSRAVAGKYAQTPWGILPLRHFFQAAGSDGDTARDDVREQVRAVFAAEDAARPLSDDEVVGTMRARGIELARRTVTKYRKELGIPSSYRRRRY
jgi:RNA polymerase sigma-54 factor